MEFTHGQVKSDQDSPSNRVRIIDRNSKALLARRQAGQAAQNPSNKLAIGLPILPEAYDLSGFTWLFLEAGLSGIWAGRGCLPSTPR